MLLVVLDPAHSSYKREQLAAPYQGLLARLQTIPGVRSASISGCTPLQGCGSGSRFLIAEGHAERPEERRGPRSTLWRRGYFETLGIPLLAGRDFSLADVARPRVAIVSRRWRATISPARIQSAGISRLSATRARSRSATISLTKSSAWRATSNRSNFATLRTRPCTSTCSRRTTFSISSKLRTRSDPAAMAETVRRIVRDVLNDVPVKRVTTLAAQVDSNIVPERLIATLSEFFGGLGAVLAGIGLYGLLAYTCGAADE